MRNFLREAAGWTSEALETACGWALCAAIVYAILFVDATGHGTLWSQLSSLAREGRSAPAASGHEGVRVIKLGPREETRRDGVALSVDYDYFRKGEADDKALVAVAQERPAPALADSPVEPAAGKDWKRALKGELRAFTIYGAGTQSASASASAPAVAAPAAAGPREAAAASTPGSAYRQGAGAASRPAVAARARALSRDGSDSVRNFKR